MRLVGPPTTSGCWATNSTGLAIRFTAPYLLVMGLTRRPFFDHGNPRLWSRDAHQAVATLRNHGYQPVATFGLSLGGLYATELLETEPGFQAGGVFSSCVIAVPNAASPNSFAQMVRGYCQSQGWTKTATQRELVIVGPRYLKCATAINIYLQTQIANHLDQLSVPFFIGQGTAD